MATETETVVFEIDVSNYEKSLAGITKSISELQKEQKKLQAESKLGSEESAVALEKVNAQIKVQQQEYRTTQAALVGYNAAQKKNIDTTNLLNNSIQTNRDYLKQLTAQYLTVQKPTQAMADKVKAVSDALKKQESAIGDNRRNVGNYTESIKNAFGAITAVIPGLKGAETAFRYTMCIGYLRHHRELKPALLLLAGLLKISRAILRNTLYSW